LSISEILKGVFDSDLGSDGIMTSDDGDDERRTAAQMIRAIENALGAS